MALIGLPRQYVILVDAEVMGSQKRSRLDGGLENPIRPRATPASKASVSANAIQTQRRRFCPGTDSSAAAGGFPRAGESCGGACSATAASAAAAFGTTTGSRNVGTYEPSGISTINSPACSG